MCMNKVTFHVPRGYTTREVSVRCGLTDPWGGRAICDECADDPAKAADHDRAEAMTQADNAASHAAGWGDW